MQTFRDSIHLAREKQLDKLYYTLNPMNHLSVVSPVNGAFEAGARPEKGLSVSEKASVHFSLVNAEKVCNLVEPVNG